MSTRVSPATGSKPALTMQSHHWTLLLVLATLWGGSYFFGKVAVEDIGPLSVVFGRVSLASIILFVCIRLRHVPLPATWAEWKPMMVMGVLNSALPFSLIFWGETRITAGLAAILTATVPVFTVIVAHFWTVDERMTPARAAGIGLGMAGVVIIMSDDLDTLTSGSGLAKLAIIGAALSYAVSGIYGRRLAGRPPLTLAWGQLSTAAVLLLPLVLFVDKPWATASWHLDAILSVIALAVLSTSLAYLIFFRLLAQVGATNTSLVTFLIPISSLLLGGIFLNEPLVPLQLVGMALIGCGMLVIDGRIWKSLRRSPQPAVRPAGD